LRQREEATALARHLSGLDLDPVEADGWWGGRALHTRWENPGESAALFGRRLLLTLDSHEYALDYAPELDANPWRPVLRIGGRIRVPLVPFGLLLGLAAAGLILRGVKRSGGWPAWTAVAACALAPLLFYVSSRYRLPLAALLVVPAGCGLSALLPPGADVTPSRRVAALTVGSVLLLLSLLLPFHDLKRSMTGEALAAQSVTNRNAGRLAEARRDAERALALAPGSGIVRFNAGTIAEESGRTDEAEALYREALAVRPDLAEAAGNLASLLIRRGRPGEAVAPLHRALAERPSSELCWNNLIVALSLAGRLDEARKAARDAMRNGVAPEPELLAEIGASGEPQGPGVREREERKP
jgi:pentatricopeptide repeat protein